jgi:hypothetical protein
MSMALHSARPALPGRRIFCAAAAAVPLAWVAGCAQMLLPRSYTFSEAELSDLLAKHFPTTQRVAEIADVTVSSPRLWLIPDHNRLGASFDLGAVDRIFRKSVQGKLALDSALRFEPSDDSIRLSQVNVQQLQLDNSVLSGSLPAQRLGGLVAERMLEGLAVYHLKPAQAQALHESGLKPDLNITSRGLELKLASP